MNVITEISQSAPQTSPISPKRGGHGELLKVPREVIALAAKINKLIGFEPGIESVNRKGGFLANNFDIYGYDVARNLIAIQYRQTWKRRETDWLNTKKAYILAGLDEGEQLFSHVLNTSYRRNPDLADCRPEQVIRWAESKIFRVPLERLHSIIRQGDVALVPVRSIPRDAEIENRSEFLLRESHRVVIDGTLHLDKAARRIWVDGTIQINHGPAQHKTICETGRFEIVLGQRGKASFVDANTVD